MLVILVRRLLSMKTVKKKVKNGGMGDVSERMKMANIFPDLQTILNFNNQLLIYHKYVLF